MAVPSQEVLAEILLEVEVRLMLIQARSLSRKTLKLWTIHLESLSLFLSIKLILNGLGFLEVSLVLLFEALVLRFLIRPLHHLAFRSPLIKSLANSLWILVQIKRFATSHSKTLNWSL